MTPTISPPVFGASIGLRPTQGELIGTMHRDFDNKSNIAVRIPNFSDLS